MVAASLLSLIALIPLALGRPSATHEFVVRDQHNVVPLGFFNSHPHFPFIPPGMLRLTVAMKQSNATGLQAALLDVSDPNSENYGHHLSKSEVEQLIAPEPEAVKTVTDWLSKNGIKPDSASPAGDMITFQIPAEKANALLNANYTTYVHEKTNTTMVRTLSYSLPASVSPHVSFVYPTTQFIPPASRKAAFRVVQPAKTTKRSRSKRANVPAQCAQAISPACLQAIYNIPPTPATAEGNSLAVSGFANEVANPDDLKDFLSQARPDIVNGTFSVLAVDGGSNEGQGTIEASLDIQYTVGLATNVPTTFVTVGDQNQDGGLSGFLDEINFLLGQPTVPLVLTTSFGFDEAPFTQAPELAVTLCTAYAQLGARGTSVLFASGDGGVSGPQANNLCDDGPFSPTFPSGCPFVTSVGSTQGINPETAAPFSSGGFSNIFAQPDYQSGAVAAFLSALGNTNAGRFNAQGRAFPDVSTQGVQFLIDVGGRVGGVDGTSASSPTFASVVALLNDARLNLGMAPLGFLNPFLYSQGAAALNDITEGSNPGCGTDGFPAVPGWDPVTGLGTPDFQKLLTLVTGSAATGNGTDAQDGQSGNGNSTVSAAPVDSTSTGVASTSAVLSSATDVDALPSSTETGVESASAILSTALPSASAVESSESAALPSASAVASSASAVRGSPSVGVGAGATGVAGEGAGAAPTLTASLLV